MKTRMWLAISLGILCMAGALWSMEQSPAQESGSPPDEALITKIYPIRYHDVDDLAQIVMAVTEGRVGIVRDERSNQLIVTGTRDGLQQIERLISALDVADDTRGAQAQQVIYRVYMLEIPPKGSNLTPFAMALSANEPPSALQVLAAIKGEDLQIGRLSQGGQFEEYAPEGPRRIVIEGRAASREVLERVAKAIPNSTITELKWSEEAFVANVPVAQLAQLPPPLQQHVRKFLGPEIATVGYWFGSVSSDGETEAPIGPWMLKLKTSVQGTNLRLEIDVRQEPTADVAPATLILSNSVQSKVGKPILIGYNRDCYGIRTMGALAIIPEEDTM